MNVTLNGLQVEIDTGTTVSRLLVTKALPSQGVAVAVNGDVVRSVDWPGTLIGDGDVIDIVTARQGG